MLTKRFSVSYSSMMRCVRLLVFLGLAPLLLALLRRPWPRLSRVLSLKGESLTKVGRERGEREGRERGESEGWRVGCVPRGQGSLDKFYLLQEFLKDVMKINNPY
jgi:hypothetical protein